MFVYASTLNVAKLNVFPMYHVNLIENKKKHFMSFLRTVKDWHQD